MWPAYILTSSRSSYWTRYTSDNVCINFHNYSNWIYTGSFAKFILCVYTLLCQHSPLAWWVRIPFRRGALDTTLWDKVCQWLAVGRWFSPGTPVSSTNKTDGHDITEILLRVVLNTINQPIEKTTMCTTIYVKCSLYSRWSNEVLVIVLRPLFCSSFSSLICCGLIVFVLLLYMYLHCIIHWKSLLV
jgi:hypothetical protein